LTHSASVGGRFERSGSLTGLFGGFAEKDHYALYSAGALAPIILLADGLEVRLNHKNMVDPIPKSGPFGIGANYLLPYTK
jgi:hypothetical protein